MHQQRQNVVAAVTAGMLTSLALVAVGGQQAGATTGYHWTQASPATSPSPRYASTAAYDTAHHDTVLFGGDSTGTPMADTWTWDGTNWTQQPTSGPGPRYGASMAYDDAHHQTVLFGGISGGYLGDTWIWDGVTWTQSLAASPPGRGWASMAYDAVHHRVVLYGGLGAGGLLDDTWLWDGHSWTRSSPGPSPGARYSQTMTFDKSDGRIVMFGGDVAGNCCF